MRRNAPALVDPANTVRAATDRNLGIVTPHDVGAALDEMERLVGRQNRELNQARAMLAAAEAIAYASPNVLFTSSLKGTVTPTNVTSTGGVTITNSNITTVAGIRYLGICVAAMTLNAPAGQSIYCCARIGATGTTVDGMQTTTVGGERFGIAVAFLEFVGTGGSMNFAGRARVTGGTGTVNDALSFGIAIPQGGMVEV